MILFAAALGLCLLAAVFSRGFVLAAAGACAVGAGVAGTGWSLWLPQLLPFAGVRLALDPMGGLFLAVTGAVTVCAAIYGIGYRARAGAVVPLFAAAMFLVPAAASVSTFLLAWELMALTSLVLVCAEHNRRGRPVGRAALWYAVMTHLAFAAILVGLALFATHGESFADLRAAALSPAARNAVFLATFAGFACKAGIVPLHVWLPRAHAEAPSPVSALMSAAMVNLGCYGIVRVGLDLLHGGPQWWWLLVLVLGAASALYGILQAVVAADLKRLLAYSTTENMGLILIGVGAAGLFMDTPALASLALLAALLHVVNHAAFKSLLFLSAGSVLHATGLRDLDRLGGLRDRMPYTTVLFGVGALAASALPPGNAFFSEWLLLQSLIHALPGNGVAAAVTMPLAVAAIALTAGLAVATFVKAFGVGFLAKPRSPEAAGAHESPPAMLAGMGLAGACCLLLSLAPTTVVPVLQRAAAVVLPGAPVVAGQVTVLLTGVSGAVSPLLIAASLITATGCLMALVRLRGRRREARLWDCGGGPMSARMEYTATSFAEPLQRVFDDVLAPESDVSVTPVRHSAYLVERMRFHARVPDRIERRLYDPLIARLDALGAGARRLADGSIHRYLAYGFAACTGVLLLLAVLR
ncbi:proton-conducting transporter membrane subunit [Nonomuraea sp. NPDC050556]|uniref:proton-conducting transporter transmembrane domain-containing protein n=1 Tax=Nonomuraea sp. NPDC050556 TaxID=3364369 RepID=UPI0037B4E4C1